MIVRDSELIRQNYNEIVELCKLSGTPVYLAANGEIELVIMDAESFEKREKMLKLRDDLLKVAVDRLYGSRGYSVDEVLLLMKQRIENSEPCDNFDEQILDELLKDGLKGDDLISAFEEKKSQVPSAMESIKSQARETAQRNTEYYTYDDVFEGD